MAKDLNYLNRQMRKYAKALGQDAKEFQKDLTLAVVAEVSKRTPVDVGTARSNWRVSIGAQLISYRKAFSPFVSRWRAPYGPGGSLGETRNQAGVVWSAAGALKSLKDGEAIYINNNLPYIGPLNRGHSPQARSGFIKRGIRAGQQRVIASYRMQNVNKV